ncbi:MAG: hypothetical protein IPJ32_04550 [Sphingobacteriaceae bacterium]|nr:hypothetical protein [Sphingobacteriaceae bacterium]
MKKAIIFLELFIVSSLLACNNNADKNIDSHLNQTASLTLSEIVADFTKTFQGTINNKYEIEMTLTKKGSNITGAYKYTTQNSSLTLKGTIDASGNLNLNEFNSKGSITGFFKGKLAGSSISGTWEKPDGSKSFPFKVSEQSAAKSSPSWAGKYVDEFGRILTISTPKTDGEINFSVVLANANCEEGEFSWKVYLESENKAFGAQDDIKIQLVRDDANTITITEDSPFGTHGARCGDTGGTYKRKNVFIHAFKKQLYLLSNSQYLYEVR